MRSEKEVGRPSRADETPDNRKPERGENSTAADRALPGGDERPGRSRPTGINEPGPDSYTAGGGSGEGGSGSGGLEGGGTPGGGGGAEEGPWSEGDARDARAGPWPRAHGSGDPGAMTMVFSRARPRLIVAGLIVLGVVLVAGHTAWMEARHLKVLDDVESSLSAISSYRAALVQSWIRERVDDARMVAHLPAVGALLRKRSAPTGGKAASDPQAATDGQPAAGGEAAADGGHAAAVDVIGVMDRFWFSEEFLAGLVTDADGRIVTGSTLRPPVADQVRDAAVAAVRSGHPVMVASYAPEGPAVRVAVAAPVPRLDREGDDAGDASRLAGPPGAVVHVVDPKVHIFPLLNNPAVQGETGETLVAQLEPGGLVPLSPLRLGDRAGTGDGGPGVIPVVRPLPDRPQPGPSWDGFFEATDHRGERVFVASRPIKDSRWVVISKIDQADALASFHRERWWTFAAMAALYLAVVAAATALWRQYRARYYKALAAEEARYLDLFRQSHDAAGIVAGGRVVLANPAATRLWGFKGATDLLGRDAVTLLTPEAAQALRERAGASPTAPLAPETIETTARRADGSTFEVELRMSRLAWQGAPALLVTARDVTERRRAADALQRYQALAENTRDIILFVDLDGRILDANRAAVQAYGHDHEVLRRTNIADLRAPGHGPSVRDRLAQARLGEVFYETAHRRNDGTVFPVEVSARAIVIGGRPIVLAVIRDITERKRLERQSLLAQRMESLGRLAGGVAHDFNNLLTAIRGYAGLIQETIQPDDPRWADLDEIIRSSDRASNLTRQLLAFSRQQASEPRVVDMNELVRGLQKMLRRVIGEDVELETRLVDGTASVRADPSQIENLLVNLAVNARDAMPGGGKLTVSTSFVTLCEDEAQGAGLSAGEYVRLRVSDTGVGMTEEVRSRAFEPFFTTKDQSKGTGLGLSTCYGIVKQHRGQILIESEPGRGTEILVDLPRTHESPSDLMPPAEGAGPRGSETVLLAEDDPGVRAFTARVLRDHGYNVIETTGGVEALSLVAGQRGDSISLLVSDVVMPRMGGIELRDRLRAIRPGIRTLFISGYTEAAAVRVGGLELGTHVLRKPFTPTSLARKVREVLDAAPPGD